MAQFQITAQPVKFPLKLINLTAKIMNLLIFCRSLSLFRLEKRSAIPGWRWLSSFEFVQDESDTGQRVPLKFSVLELLPGQPWL